MRGKNWSEKEKQTLICMIAYNMTNINKGIEEASRITGRSVSACKGTWQRLRNEESTKAFLMVSQQNAENEENIKNKVTSRARWTKSEIVELSQCLAEANTVAEAIDEFRKTHNRTEQSVRHAIERNGLIIAKKEAKSKETLSFWQKLINIFK